VWGGKELSIRRFFIYDMIKKKASQSAGWLAGWHKNSYY